MKDKFKIRISKPCAEKFDRFEPSAAGGYCRSCQKEVVDFTTMSDREISRYFRDQTQTTCGRFRSSQIKTYSPFTRAPGQRRPGLMGAGLLSFSLLSFLATGDGYAQHQKPLPALVSNAAAEKTAPNTTNHEKHRVAGVVTDGEWPLPDVSVTLKGSAVGTVTDIDGKFEFPELVAPGSVLIFSYIGYISQEYTVVEGASEAINVSILFEEEYYDLMGEVSVHQVYTAERTLWQKLSGWLR